MALSHIQTPRPSSLLALVCLVIVHRLRPQWTAISVRDAVHAESLSPERISRLASRAIQIFELALATLCRRGRPPADDAATRVESDHAITAELLRVATSLLTQLLPHRLPAAARALLIGAHLRLHAAHPQLTQKRFCDALAIPTRTFRTWLTQTPSIQIPAPQDQRSEPGRRPLRRGRFNFNVLLPDTQLAADTTDLSAFGVPLKLIAAQDVGGRDQDLFDAVIVDDHENAALVIDVLSQALADSPGAQAITDQGTPYMAEATTAAIEALEVEHAPQKEGDPLGKATIERAFGSLKKIAAPLLAITDSLAAAVPALKSPALAKTFAKIVITALLRAYQAGARAARRADTQRHGLDPDALTRAAQQSREQARAGDRSARLLLSHIHGAYQIDIPLANFIRQCRGFPLPVLREAEQGFARQAHRDDIKKRAAYFAAIVRACNDNFRAARVREQAAARDQAQRNADNRTAQQRLDRWHDRPAEWLASALETIAASWLPDRHELLFGGVGAGTGYLRRAVARLTELLGPASASDTALGVIENFSQTWRPQIGDSGVAAVRAVFERHLSALPTPNATDRPTNDFDRKFATAILHPTGPPRRPAPPRHLRN
jgi:hypothetical protein